MYEYMVMNNSTEETKYICGYSFEDACRRAKVNGADYKVLFVDYID